MINQHGQQLIQERKEFKSAVLSDVYNVSIFKAKIREMKEYLADHEQHLDSLLRRTVAEQDINKKEWLKWAVDREKERKKKTEKDLTKFLYYLSKCQGKYRDSTKLDVESAKNVPIGILIGADTRQSGHRRMYKCPIHNEKTPSFCWYVQQNRWWCFGENIGGDSIDLFMRLHNCDFKEAVAELNKF